MKYILTMLRGEYPLKIQSFIDKELAHNAFDSLSVMTAKELEHITLTSIVGIEDLGNVEDLGDVVEFKTTRNSSVNHMSTLFDVPDEYKGSYNITDEPEPTASG